MVALCGYYYSMFEVIYTTLPKRRKARQILKVLLKEKLVIYGNILKTDSAYIVENKPSEDREYILILILEKGNIDEVLENLNLLHPYRKPLIIHFTVNSLNEKIDFTINTKGDK